MTRDHVAKLFQVAFPRRAPDLQVIWFRGRSSSVASALHRQGCSQLDLLSAASALRRHSFATLTASAASALHRQKLEQTALLYCWGFLLGNRGWAVAADPPSMERRSVEPLLEYIEQDGTWRVGAGVSGRNCPTIRVIDAEVEAITFNLKYRRLGIGSTVTSIEAEIETISGDRLSIVATTSTATVSSMETRGKAHGKGNGK